MQKVEVFGEVPLPRFGHTITSVSKTKVVLFGGATGNTGKYNITGDTYSFDCTNSSWKKIEGLGIAPSPRAAHASTSVDYMQLVVYGGATGGGSLASDDLFLLDLRNGEEKCQWMIVPVVGSTPGRRYGHTVVFAKPNILVFGGNTGTDPVNDVWTLNVDKAPFTWVKLDIEGDIPPVRVYHSAALCSTGSATGMMVLFGGRTIDQSALNDTWGLRRHRDGRWDWVLAPYKVPQPATAGTQGTTSMPLSRYQHSTLFLGPLMLVMGGRTNQVGEKVSLEVYDTETSEWHKYPPLRRFRHSSWNVDTTVHVFGGFEHDSPSIPTDQILKIDILALFQTNMSFKTKLMNFYHNTTGGVNSQPSIQSAEERKKKEEQEKKASTSSKNFHLSPNVQVFQGKVQSIPIERLEESKIVGGTTLGMGGDLKKGLGSVGEMETLHSIFISQLLKPKEWSTQIDPDPNMRFYYRKEHIMALADECLAIVQEQPMVLRIRAPIKVFGDIHGQYQDLMRFFHLWGAPTQNGDIESYDYLFLGDYVDRGSHSLETICLLMSLKIKYPDQIHMLRGNHEDRWINNAFGFADECSNRLGEDPNERTSIFNKINQLFDHLPLAAIINDKIICLHGGIGSTLEKIEQIEALERPLEVIHEVSNKKQQLVVDILWSDPTDNDEELGIQPNYIRDPNGTGNIVKFGPDKVVEFCKNNKLSMILRAHECVMDGFERFAAGNLITVFSATDYCGRHKNAGAVLFINKKYEIVPKLIFPLNNPEQNWITDEEPLRKRPPTPPRWSTGQMARQQSFD